jgi:hypothetical protein
MGQSGPKKDVFRYFHPCFSIRMTQSGIVKTRDATVTVNHRSTVHRSTVHRSHWSTGPPVHRSHRSTGTTGLSSTGATGPPVSPVHRSAIHRYHRSTDRLSTGATGPPVHRPPVSPVHRSTAHRSHRPPVSPVSLDHFSSVSSFIVQPSSVSSRQQYTDMISIVFSRYILEWFL